MKHIFKISKYISKVGLTIASMLLMALTACVGVLDDVDNLSQYPPDKVWSSEDLASAYLSNLYASTMPSWPTNSGVRVDECGPGVVGADYITSQNTTFRSWSYATVRKINILLDEIDGGTLDTDVRSAIKGQAYFLRAWNYFDMVSNQGGVPIIKDPQGLDEDLMVSRNSTAECFDFIIEDLDSAYNSLPNRYKDNDFGRIDKATVLAFKGRVLLHKASPQFNPSNPYDNSYWQAAYDANKDAKDKLASWGYELISSYDDLFKKEKNNEVIMATVYINPGKTNGRSEHGVRPLSESKNATGYDQPIWSLVEAYPMLDGKKVGESSKYTYDVQTYWENRDPRFEATIACNGALFELSGIAGRRQYNTYDLVPSGIASPLDIFGDKQDHGTTGFYCRKGLEIGLPADEVETNSTDWVEIRYAEVLLNYAEAANETGKSAEALEVLKSIRKRAGIEEGSDGTYGLGSGLSKEQTRDAILAERRIEFAFEGKRLDDLRRTRRWHLLNGTKKYGLEAFVKDEFKNPDGTLTKKDFLPEDFTYTVREVINNNDPLMYIPESYYFFPIRQGDLEKNPKLVQNVGWDGGTFDPTLH
ncbi:MAG: RagB/SusD family nutrient uptake outer membrane protein [Bacteroidales bacterium]